MSTHIRWGDKDSDRTEELRHLAKWVDDKVTLMKKGGKAWNDRDIFVIGDFNIPSRRSPLFEAMTSRGLQIPNALLKQIFGSNYPKSIVRISHPSVIAHIAMATVHIEHSKR